MFFFFFPPSPYVAFPTHTQTSPHVHHHGS
jgi:hypothetical protein